MKPTHRGSATFKHILFRRQSGLVLWRPPSNQSINRTPSIPSRLTAKTIIWNRLEEVKQWHHSTSLENDPFFNTTVLQIKQLGSRWFSLILPQNWISRTQRHSRSKQTISMGQRGGRLLSLAMQYQQNQSEKKVPSERNTDVSWPLWVWLLLPLVWYQEWNNFTGNFRTLIRTCESGCQITYYIFALFIGPLIWTDMTHMHT